MDEVSLLAAEKTFVKSSNDERKAVIEALLSSHRMEDAISLLNAAVSQGVRPLEAFLTLADIQEEMGNLDEARSTLERAQKASPTNPWASVKLARLINRHNVAGSASASCAEAQKLLRTAGSGIAEARHMAPVFNEFCDLDAQFHVERCHVSTPPDLTKLRPATPSAVVVSMVKDEEDIIAAFLDYNYLIGFRKFAIMDNGSHDRTSIEILKFQEKRKDAIVAYVKDPIIGYYQDNKTTALVHFARHYFPTSSTSVDWVFPLDADEFITFSPNGEVSNLQELIARANDGNFNVIQYYLINCASDRILIRWDGNANPFSDFPIRENLKYRKSAKVAFRYTSDALLHMGNHFVANVFRSLDEVLVASSLGVVLSHFSLRSVLHARSKYVNGGTAYANAPDRAKHGRAWQLNFERFKLRGDMFFMDMVREYIDQVKTRSDEAEGSRLRA